LDSTQIASNIVFASRLQLLVESVQQIERILNEADRGAPDRNLRALPLRER
jgi:hypothetical protein